MIRKFTNTAAGFLVAATISMGAAADGQLEDVLMGSREGCMSGPVEQFGRYIGDWDIADEGLSREDGKTWSPGNGARWNFTCVGNGIAVQDFWMPNGPKGSPPPGVGTNLRIYNPATESWQIAWTATNSPGLGEITAKMNEAGEIIMHWKKPPAGGPRRITFFPPTAEGWNWKMEMTRDEGQTWFAVYRMKATPRQ